MICTNDVDKYVSLKEERIGKKEEVTTEVHDGKLCPIAATFFCRSRRTLLLDILEKKILRTSLRYFGQY
jgi:hypothetical protein